jgi:hypothetical protein
MRAGVFLVSAALVMAALAPSAYAGTRADYKLMFTTPVPGTSTGTDTQILYKNPNDPKAKPIPVRQEVFTFPDGTTYDGSVVPDCNASDVEIMLFARDACPADSWVGGGIGDTTMSGFDNEERALDLDAWDQGDVVVVYGRDHQTGIGGIERITQNGQTFTVDMHRSPGGPPDGETAVRRVRNVFPARSAGNRAYIRTPPTCPPSGVWTFTARFTFADGVVEHDRYDMPCQRPPAASSKAARHKRHRHHGRHRHRRG